MDKEELDRQYTPSLWSNRLPARVIVDNHIQVLTEATAHARKTLKCDLGVCYDEDSGQLLDIYYPSSSSVPENKINGESEDRATVLVYFHGGYWCALGLEEAGFFAENCCSEGITLVAVGYDLAPKVSMTTIVDQCRKACAYVCGRFPKCRLHVCGHSAGGHLAACMMYTDWPKYGVASQPLSGALLLSGIYNLDPIQRSHVDRPLKLTEKEVQELSPLKNLEAIQSTLPSSFPCLVAAGGSESDEFQRQSEEFHQALLSVGVASTSSTLPGFDHFLVNEVMIQKSNSFTTELLHFLTTSSEKSLSFSSPLEDYCTSNEITM